MNRDGTELCHYCGEYSSSPKCNSCANEEKRIQEEELNNDTEENKMEKTKDRVTEERTRIIERIKAQICFDALADSDGRCEHHGGKCYELGLLVKVLIEEGQTPEKAAAPICPSCDGFIPNNETPGAYMGALSRKDNKTEICSACGVAEALEDFMSNT
jgi:hypothetical protein